MSTSIRAILALFLVSLFLITLIPDEASAIPYKIEGYLEDSQGVPITLADIKLTGEVYNLSIQDYDVVEVHTSTDANGYYRFFVAGMEPGGFDEGATITVSYSTSDDSVSRVISVQGQSSWANLTYSEKTNILDTLASPIGVISAVILISTVFIGYYIYRSSDTDDSMNKKERDGSKRVERRRR